MGMFEILPAITTLLGAGAAAADIKSRSDAAINAMNLEVKSYKAQLSAMERQENELDQQLFGSLSQRSIEALKAEARLRAGAASTGTSGGSTDASVRQSYMDYALDAAVLSAKAAHEKRNILTRMNMLDVSFDNRISDMSSNIISPFAAGLKTMTGAMTGFQSGYSMLSESARESFFSNTDQGH